LFFYIYFNNFSFLISISLLIGSIQFIAASFFIDWFFIFKERLGIFAIRNVFVSILTLVGVIILVKGVSDLPLYFLITSVSLLISNFFLIKYSDVRITLRFDLDFCRKILKQSFPIGVTFFLSIFIDSFGIIYLGFSGDEVSAGLFSSAIKYIILATLPIFVLQNAFALKISSAISLEDRIKIAFNHSKVLLSVGAIMVSLSFVFSDVIIHIIFGEKFMEASNILKILSVSLLFYYIIYVSNTPLIYWHQEKITLFAYIITFFLTILTTVLLSDRYNAIGASISFIIATISLSTFLSIFLYRMLHRHFILQVVPFLGFSFLTTILFRFLGNLFTSNFYILVIPALLSVLIYFLIINKLYFSSILFNLNKVNSSDINKDV